MSSAPDRWVVLGLAHVRSPWFADLAGWSTAAVLPIEFVKCLSAEEVRARIASSRPFSALVIDAGIAALDRDLIDTCTSRGCAVLVVEPELRDDRARARAPRLLPDWQELGAAARLPCAFGPDDLLDLLAGHAPSIDQVDRALGAEAAPTITMAWRGRVVTVLGGGGTGSSSMAMAIANHLGSDPRHRGLVLLADLALHADQALLHHVGDVVPGLQELVEANRLASPGPDEIRSFTVRPAHVPYGLLMGLRRHRDWASLRPRAVAAAIDGLRRTFSVVVADVDPDLEGEGETGSHDLEDRNLLARLAVAEADAVVVTGTASVVGVQRMVRHVRDVIEAGAAPERVLPLVNRAPRSPTARSELNAAIAALSAEPGRGAVNPAVFVPERRRMASEQRDAVALSGGPSTIAGRAVQAVLDRVGDLPVAFTDHSGPERVVPGSLGVWTGGEGVAG